MSQFEPLSWVRAGLASFLHAQRCLHQKYCCTMIRKPHSVGWDLTSLRQQAARRFSRHGHRSSSRIAGVHRFSDAKPDFLAIDRSRVNRFPTRWSVHGFLPLRLPASPFRVPGTGWAPLGRVGVSAETPGAGSE
ncbi:hypothetical protein NDU88_002091 [Pleurodeles waltl]|uniref:Uncharacterized protein n=1 Tax=Pleurodeles waltl TaxID=8319 RepID=A0AAV7VDJ0_PLEWA|nr:hypothetical protein NDU88_002091 [Pleurodeles waltl]